MKNFEQPKMSEEEALNEAEKMKNLGDNIYVQTGKEEKKEWTTDKSIEKFDSIHYERASRLLDYEREKKQKEEVFFNFADDIIKEIEKKKEKLSGEEREKYISDILKNIENIPNFRFNDRLLDKRNQALECVLPNYPILETNDKDAKWIGYAIQEYYYNPAAFSHSPLVGGDARETKVVGSNYFYSDWNIDHEGQQLFVIPGVLHTWREDLNEKYEPYLSYESNNKDSVYKSYNDYTSDKFGKIKEYEEERRKQDELYQAELDKHTLMTAKVACLFLEGDYLMKDDGISDDENCEDNPGYSIYKYKEKK